MEGTLSISNSSILRKNIAENLLKKTDTQNRQYFENITSIKDSKKQDTGPEDFKEVVDLDLDKRSLSLVKPDPFKTLRNSLNDASCYKTAIRAAIGTLIYSISTLTLFLAISERDEGPIVRVVLFIASILFLLLVKEDCKLYVNTSVEQHTFGYFIKSSDLQEYSEFERLPVTKKIFLPKFARCPLSNRIIHKANPQKGKLLYYKGELFFYNSFKEQLKKDPFGKKINGEFLGQINPADIFSLSLKNIVKPKLKLMDAPVLM